MIKTDVESTYKSRAKTCKIVGTRLIKAFNRRGSVATFEAEPYNKDNKTIQFKYLPLFAQAILVERNIARCYKRRERGYVRYGIIDVDGIAFEVA